MAFDYQPFLISNLRHGLELGIKPWLAPEDAFVELVNAYLQLGALYKRKGYVPFGRLAHQAIDEVIGTGDGAEKTFTDTLAHYPVRVNDISITDGVEIFTDADGDGVLTGDQGGTGTIDYDTGDFSVTFFTEPGNLVDILATYHWHPDLPCLGIFNYASSGGGQDLLAWTTKRVNKYNETTDRFDDISGADQFTGYDYEYFWFVNWLNKGFMTNSRDQIKYFDGLNLTDLVIDLSDPPDAVNDLNTAYLIFPYKDRLIFLRTMEFGNLYPARARWTKVGKYDESEPLAYADAPTHEWIMGATFIRNELVVFFERSVWLLRYTGDSRLPFRWIRVSPNEGLMAKMGMIDFSNEAVGIGPTRLIATDGTEVYNLDDKIPHLVLQMNQGALAYCYATAIDERSQMWMSYPSSGQTLPDKALALNYDEKSFAIFDLPHLVTGYYQENEDLTWDEIEETWDEIEWSWDDRQMQAGYPATLGGDHSGYVWKLNSGGSDNGAAIEMTAKMGRWNPFLKKGKQARLEYVDFLVDRDPWCQLQVDYYLDHETAPYLTDLITLDDGSTSEKIWVRSYVGCEANFHQLRLYNQAMNQSIVIHAIMPWMAAAGDLD